MAELDALLPAILRGLGMTALTLLWVIFLIRASGRRSLAKMTGFDFVTTVAVGSLIGTAGTSSSPEALAQSVAPIGALFAIQWGLAASRARSAFAARLLGNDPVLLMGKGRFIEEALAKTRVTRADIYAKMRKAGVTRPHKVRAIVLERAGDISIIVEEPIDARILKGVRRFGGAKARGGDAAGS